jgi:hypothetical protein
VIIVSRWIDQWKSRMEKKREDTQKNKKEMSGRLNFIKASAGVEINLIIHA